jgi:hypothetical protein
MEGGDHLFFPTDPPILTLRPLRRGRRASPAESCLLERLPPRSEAMDMDLFARVRERLVDGTLWPLTNDHVIGGPVTNEPCAVCDQAITVGETEYEVAGPVMIAHVHVACYHAWSGESQRSA